MLRVIYGIQVPRNSETTVVVIVPDTIAIIPVVEVGSLVSIRVLVERQHHVLASLIDCKDIIACAYITQGAADVGKLVKLVRPLGKTVLLCSAHRCPIKGDVAICLCEVVATLLCKQEEIIKVVWNLLPRLIEGIQVIIVRVSAFIVGKPDWLACRLVNPHHVIHAVHALQPTEIIIFQILIARRWIENPSSDSPLSRSLVIGHGACGVHPVSTAILGVLVIRGVIDCRPVIFGHFVRLDLCKALRCFRWVCHGRGLYHGASSIVLDEYVGRAAILGKHVDVSCHERGSVLHHLILEVRELLSLGCHKFLEVAIVQAFCRIAVNFLEAKERRVVLVHVEVGLRMEVGV